MAIMENWSIVTDDSCDRYLAPEQIKNYLQGNVYDHPKFEDGEFIHTSRIIDIQDCNDHKLIRTKNTEYEVYPEEMDTAYEKAYPNAYERLKIIKE